MDGRIILKWVLLEKEGLRVDRVKWCSYVNTVMTFGSNMASMREQSEIVMDA